MIITMSSQKQKLLHKKLIIKKIKKSMSINKSKNMSIKLIQVGFHNT